jgi:ribosomal protein S14
MLSAKIHDLKIRNSLYKIEKLKKINKFLFINFLNNKTTFSPLKRTSLLISFLKIKNKISLKARVRMTNRCVLNNRNRGVFRPFGISRILLRNLMQFGVLPGYFKAVW